MGLNKEIREELKSWGFDDEGGNHALYVQDVEKFVEKYLKSQKAKIIQIGEGMKKECNSEWMYDPVLYKETLSNYQKKIEEEL